MQAPPLTHHDILGLVAPFSRRGRQVDLGASQRAERQLVFKPVEHPAASPGEPGLLETLKLDVFAGGGVRLTRLLRRSDGRQATLQAVGPKADELLDRFETVPRARHFEAGPGYTIVRDYEFEAEDGDSPPPVGAAPVLARGVIHVDGLTMRLDVPAMRGGAAEIAIEPDAAGRPDLPEDLLAVLGWDWARLVPGTEGWTTRRRLRGSRARRGRIAEAAVKQAATHLARVLAEPPARFHERHVAARWGVVFRRAIPTLTALGMIFGAFLLTLGPRTESAGMPLILHYASIGLLGFSFCLQELPRFEIPPLPRQHRGPAWRAGAPAPIDVPEGDACSATR
jgi:hypothetical protein